MKNQNTDITKIEDCILVVRGKQVMLDRDLAMLYGVETRRLNEAVKRNKERFPEDFMFQLDENEKNNLMSQIATSSCPSISESYASEDNLMSQNATSSEGEMPYLCPQAAAQKWGGQRKLPFAFTENGIAMLSSVLRSQTAIEVNIRIMRAFTSMRQFLAGNAQVFQRLETIEYHQLEMKMHQERTDQQLVEVFRRIDEKKAQPTQGIFYDGQIFDAYTFVCDLIRNAQKRIVLIDNYVDDTVLKRLDKRNDGVEAIIYTKGISPKLQVDLNAHNCQFAPIQIKQTSKAHDRFLIIDDEVYAIGASIKDLGKKIFAFNKMNEPSAELLARV